MDSSPEVISKDEGLRLIKAGQLDDGIRVLEKLSDKDGDDPQVWSYLGAAYSKKDDKLQAIHAFEEALRLQETPKAYFNLAAMYESVGRIDEAVRDYRMAADLDPSYAPAQEALNRLHSKFAGDHPDAQPAPAVTQVMAAGAPAGAAAVTQTQAFSGPPPGPTVGQAPTPLADPFARQFAAPPTHADVIAEQMKKEQDIADLHHKLMKSGIIYGAICGAIFFVILSLVSSLMVTALGGKGWIITVIYACVGAAYGSLIGLWIGYTCGGDGAGFQAGGVLGLLYGIVIGLLLGSPILMVLLGVVYGLFSGFVGWIIGRMVDMSITD